MGEIRLDKMSGSGPGFYPALFLESGMKKQQNDFLNGSILPSLLRFAGPVLLALFLQAMYGAVDLIVVGKTDQAEVRSLVAAYLKRLNFYAKVTLTELPDLKNTRSLSAESQKRQEGEALLRQFGEGDYVVLLDEKGAQLRSVDFALWLQKRMNSGLRRLCFVIGGPYGFSPKVYERADGRLSLSAMTFSHQIVRALFAEQLYRAFTIIRNEPYHHE